MDARELEGCNRAELIARAESTGVDNAKVLTRTELVDEILRRSVSDPVERQRARGLLGIARDLVARVVERGLHLPDAAAVIRGGRTKPSPYDERPPIATVTLAEIYASQGHRARALAVLDEVLANEPDHAAARLLRDRVAASSTDDAAGTLDVAGSETTSNDGDAGAQSEADGAEVTLAWGTAFVGAHTAAPPDTARSGAVAREWPLGGAPDVTATEANDVAVSSDDADERVTDVRSHPADLAAAQPAVPEDEAPLSAPAESAPTAPGPVGMLDDAPLPPFYDVDEVVLMPVDPTTVYLYWEVRRSTLEQAQVQAPEGKLVLRILAVTPSPAGPNLMMRDIDLPGLVGDWVMRDMPIGAVLRAAVGWRRGAAFAPLSVAMELTAPPAAPASAEAHQLARFGRHATTDEPLDGETAAQALGQRRRAAGVTSQRDSVSWTVLGSS